MDKYLVTILCAAIALGANAQARNSLLNRGRNSRTAAAPAAAASTATAEASAATTEEGAVSDLNFKEAPVEMIFEVYGKLVDRTVLKDPATPSATITLESRPGQKLTKEEQIEAIEVVCEMNGIHFENYGDKFVRALPRKEAGKEGIPLYMDAASEELEAEPMGKVVSVMLNFKNISAQEEALKALEGFKSNSGLLQVFERTNSILVTDTKQNFVRMLAIARAIDIATPVLENVYVRQIKNASATDIKTALEQIVTESQKELEKTGKAQQNAQASAASRSSTPPTTLLRRPGQNRDAPAAPTPLESLVTSVSDADRGMIRGKVLILADERSNKLVVITSKSNMDFFDRVIEQLDVETTPDTLVKVYRLKYAEAEDVSDMINDLIGNSASAKNTGTGRGNQNQNARQGSGGNLTRNTQNTQQRTPANQRTGEPKAGELSKDNTTVLADKRINGLVVMTQKELVPTIENIIESMDVRLSQVLIETVIIEVTLGDDLKTGIDWVKLGRGNSTQVKTGPHGVGMGWYTDGNGNWRSVESTASSFTTTSGDDETTWTRMGDVVQSVAGGFWSNGGSGFQLGGGGSDSASLSLLTTLAGVATTNAASVLSPIGGGINYFLKSDKLNLGAIIQASKNDNRAKYIASPVVMTVDNKEATIDATENRQFVTGWTAQSGSYGNSGQPTPNYSSKDIGIKVKITPKINPNGTVMLTVEEEYSQYVANGQNMLIPQEGKYTDGKVDLARERKMSADILLEHGQTVVLGGLTQTSVSESESGIPLLKDIPWIGKWLFGSVNQTESRNELLVFMTPYVLDDAEMAQAEALRRKRALSDQSPWEDHGWSASKLADPMPKKEQMRRFKEEWKKQDEERKTRLAIEKMKMDRAKALESMDEAERKFWIEAHRDELEAEERERFDEFLKEQEDNRALVEQIKRKEMEKAQEKIDEADEAMRSENERGRLERSGQLPGMKQDASPEPSVPAAPENAPAGEETPAPVEAPAQEPSPVAAPAVEGGTDNFLGDLAK